MNDIEKIQPVTAEEKNEEESLVLKYCGYFYNR